MDDTSAKDIESLQANARVVIEQLGPLYEVELGYNKQSVLFVHDFIEGLWDNESLKDDPPAKQLDMLGAFLGECIAVNVGGSWQWSEDHQTYGIAFKAGAFEFVVHPINKVWKHFKNGSKEGGDGILGFYETAVEVMAKGMFDDVKHKKTSVADTNKTSSTESKQPTANFRPPFIVPHLRLPVSIIGAVCLAIVPAGITTTLLGFDRRPPMGIYILLLFWCGIAIWLWRVLGPRK